RSFIMLSQSLLDEGRLAYEDPGAPGVELRAFRSLLYPIVLAAAMRVHAGIPGVLVLQALLGIVVVGCIFRVGRDTLGVRYGVVGASIGALYWTSVYFERQILTESLYSGLLVIGVTLALPALRQRSLESHDGRRHNLLALAAGLVLGLAGVTKPAGVLTLSALVATSLVIILIHYRRRGGDRDGATVSPGRLAIVLVGAAIVIGPAVARNQAVLGKPVLLTSGGMNLWTGNEVGTLSDAWVIMRAETAERGEVAMERWFYSDTWNHRAEIASRVPRLFIKKFRGLFAPLSRDIDQLPHRLILPFAFLGLVLARPKQWWPWILVLSVVFTHVALGLVFVAYSRYRMPIDPFLWMLAAAAIVVLWDKGKTGRIVLVGVVGLNLLVRLAQ
ncbi:MAG: hypothetical protein PVF33_08365, partial [Candidatus Latescibacterota bacterium]